MSVLVGRVVVVEVDGWLINVWSTGAGCRRSSGSAGAVAVAGRTKSRRARTRLGSVVEVIVGLFLSDAVLDTKLGRALERDMRR